MPEPAPRRSLAARRRTTKVLELDDDFDDKENSLNDSLTGRRQTRVLNNSFNGVDEPAQTPRQLVDLYQKTVELATQGKINVKNAFSIPLVERLPQILNLIALDDLENHNLGPNFVKAGSVIDTSAKIYGFRVDALHTETQKLSGNILNAEGEGSTDEKIKEEQDRADGDREGLDCEQAETKKATRRAKAKVTSFILTDLAKITLEYEFDFRPLQPPHMCQWRGGVGADSIYSEMVSSTMYSSSDYPLINGFTNADMQPEEEVSQIDSVLDQTITKMIDLTSLRGVIKSNEGHDHILGNQTLRDFVFNETPSGSFIDTIHESCLGQIDESINRSHINNDDVDNEDGYNHEELVHAAIEDLTDEPSHTNDVFKYALTELSQDPSSIHSNIGNCQSQQSMNFNLPSTNGLLSSSFLSTMSFADQMPNLLHSKEGQSDYSYFDATKLKLFAGPNIWKFTNLLDTSTPTNNRSTVQQQQAPVTPHKITGLTREGGAKRNIRIDISQSTSIDQLMLGNNLSVRDRKAVNTSQSSLLLRMREKTFNQMQLARKLRPITDLTNSHHFPQLNFEHLDSIQRRRDLQLNNPHYDHDHFDEHDDNHHLDDESGPLSSLNFDFARPIHYEKIEFAKGASSVNAKILKRQMIVEFSRQKAEQQRTLSLDTSTASQQSSISSCQSQEPQHHAQPTVEFSILLENLADHGHLSLETDLPSAFYCMLINCNENKLYMKNNTTRDDLFIQERPFVDQRDLSTLSYSYISHSNLSMVN